MIRPYFAVRDLILRDQPVRNTLGPFRARLVRGAECVVFSADSQDGKFIGITQVIQVRETTDGDRRIQFAEFTDITRFEHAREFSVIAGSLDRVKNVLEPHRHFTRSVLKVSPRDYATIVENEVDVPRSVFRYLFAALPMEIQTAFLQQENVDLAKFYGGAGSVMKGLDEAILSFMQKRVLPQFELVAGVASAIARLNVRALPPIRELMMTDGRGEQPVALGSLSEGVARMLRENALFSEGSNRPQLLSEAMHQIHGQELG